MSAEHDLELKGIQYAAAHNADQAEWKAVRVGSAPIEEGIRDNRIAESPPDPMDEEGGPKGQTEMQLETLIVDTTDEVLRRIKLMGDTYPFKLDGTTLRYTPSQTRVYEFCLSLSFVPTINQKPYVRHQIAFERLARDLVKLHLGPGAEGYRTGHPGDTHEFRPTRIKAVISHLAGLAGEWVWRPEPGLPDDPTYKSQKDLGLDFVVWKKLSDDRQGIFCFIGQCACGRSDWDTKFGDISFEKLSSWINPIGAVLPVRMFAIPFHIPNRPHFGQVSKVAGLTLDRARLTLLAEKAEYKDKIIACAPDKYEQLIDLVIQAPPVVKRPPKQRQRKGAAGRHSRSTGTGA